MGIWAERITGLSVWVFKFRWVLVYWAKRVRDFNGLGKFGSIWVGQNLGIGLRVLVFKMGLIIIIIYIIIRLIIITLIIILQKTLTIT